MTGSLEGKTAIIAGAASGVGRAIARRFAQAGARLMLADTDDAGLDETVAEIEAEIGTEPGPETGKRPENLARFSHAIEDKLGVTNLIAATIDNFERIDVLVTNTRACAPGGLFDLTAAEFDAALNSNVRSAFLQTQLVARRMIQQRKADPEFTGALVNISSIAARRTVPELLAYSVSCAGLDQLTRSTAACLAPLGIRVNAVALGSVMTGNLRPRRRCSWPRPPPASSPARSSPSMADGWCSTRWPRRYGRGVAPTGPAARPPPHACEPASRARRPAARR
jgi:7-alpha-hydroxysteroid dehydrogenase